MESIDGYSLESLLPSGEPLAIIQELDNQGHKSIDIAMLFCYAKFKQGGVDQAFLHEPTDGLKEYYESNTYLQKLIEGPITTKGTDYVWMHFFTPIAAYRKPKLTARLYPHLFAIDQGIKSGTIAKHLNDAKKVNQFWYSVGGDMLQDWIYGLEETAELHAAILGIKVFNPNLRLSEMIQRAKYLVETNYDFTTHPYYLIGKRYINPLFGHKLLRTLGKNFSFLCKTPLLPVEDIELLP